MSCQRFPQSNPICGIKIRSTGFGRMWNKTGVYILLYFLIYIKNKPLAFRRPEALRGLITSYSLCISLSFFCAAAFDLSIFFSVCLAFSIAVIFR